MKKGFTKEKSCSIISTERKMVLKEKYQKKYIYNNIINNIYKYIYKYTQINYEY